MVIPPFAPIAGRLPPLSGDDWTTRAPSPLTTPSKRRLAAFATMVFPKKLLARAVALRLPPVRSTVSGVPAARGNPAAGDPSESGESAPPGAPFGVITRIVELFRISTALGNVVAPAVTVGLPFESS